MAVTRQEFEAFLVCPLKSHLLAHGESAPGTALTEARTELGGTFQKHGIANLLNGIPVSAVSVGAPPTGAFKKHLFHFILDWLIATPSVKSRLDGAELIRSRESDKRLTYAPLRLLPDETVSTAAKLSLAFDGIALAHISGRKSPSGRIIHGREYVRGTVSLGPYYGKVQALIAKIEMQNSKPLLPPVSLNKHCAECEFQPRCLPIAREADDLSLLTKVSVKDREKYRNKGIFTVTQLSYTFRPRRRGGTSPKYDYSLKALAIRKNQIHLASYAPPDLSGTPVYFDVEGDPDLKFYYCVGLRYAKAGKTVTHSLWADTPSDERKMWDDFVAALCKIHSPRLVHYGNYEIHFLRQMSKRYGIKGEASFLDELISSAVNLVAVIYAKAYFPTYGNGLKDIAGYLGFRWTEAGASGLLAVARRRYWEYSGVDSLKQAILQYNAEDCAAAQVVAESLAALGGSPTSAAGGRGAIDVTTLKREFPQHFGALSCVLPEFEQINNAARWDYQRDKVYVRSNERIRRLRVERRPRQQTVPINKVVSCLEQRPVECSKCHGKKIYRFGRLSQTVYDLKLSGAAVRRWVVQYSFQRYICWNCKTAFQLRFHQSKYGITFRAFVVYHLIDLLLPQRALARSLQQLFGLPLSGGMINHVKADMAAFHEQTYRAILKRIVNGPLVHADETHVAVDGKVGYVWAFTNLEDVAFVYSDNREGNTAKDVLDGFKGVLVSDFYAGYDAIPCAQQKCLIHLMRDINDDLLKQPFNDEMKDIARAFADLLRPIVESIDRYGLKARHLRKHRSAVNRFYRRLEESDLNTELAVGYQRRFKKNRDRLFTFLDCDGVPWNNNNAEHAIKAFVRLRNVIGGTSSMKGVQEYLILLSVAETCKCKGVSVLDFFGSQQTDVDDFVARPSRVTSPVPH